MYPIRRFLQTESAGGIVLLVAAAVAVVAANSPWSAGWEAIWSTEIAVDVGRWSLHHDLRHWVNDGLMAFFFFVVGLEIKRELVAGELRDPRRAAVPALAALGGMVVPAALYLAIAGGSGWGIPMATDIAFAVGVLAVLGSRVPGSLKLFLLTLAIVDDIGAIAVIAVFYSDGVDAASMAIAVALLVAYWVLRRLGVRSATVYVLLALAVWVATYESGVHATIAGVLLGLLTPAHPQSPSAMVKEWASEMSEEPTAHDVQELTRVARAGVSVAERLQHELHPWSSFVVVPVFALANAGVAIEADALDAPGAGSVAVAVVVGLVLGKLLGVLGATWLTVRSGLGTLPEGATWRHVAGVAAIAGIGFTVSLFVAGLAFDDATSEAAAKLGILGASVAAAVLGAAILLVRSPRRPPRPSGS